MKLVIKKKSDKAWFLKSSPVKSGGIKKSQKWSKNEVFGILKRVSGIYIYFFLLEYENNLVLELWSRNL